VRRRAGRASVLCRFFVMRSISSTGRSRRGQYWLPSVASIVAAELEGEISCIACVAAGLEGEASDIVRSMVCGKSDGFRRCCSV
jgi:hypothetical protein